MWMHFHVKWRHILNAHTSNTRDRATCASATGDLTNVAPYQLHYACFVFSRGIQKHLKLCRTWQRPERFHKLAMMSYHSPLTHCAWSQDAFDCCLQDSQFRLDICLLFWISGANGLHLPYTMMAIVLVTIFGILVYSDSFRMMPLATEASRWEFYLVR